MDLATAGLDAGESAPSRSLRNAKKDTDRIRAPAHAGRDFVRQAALFLQNLAAALFADHAVKVAHHHGEWMRTERGADNVVRGADVGHPVAHRLVHGFLERALARQKRRALRRHRGAYGTRSTIGGACPPRPCKSRTRSPSSRTSPRWRCRAGPRPSRR